MSLSRRSFVVAGLSLFAAACAENTRIAGRPGVPWPDPQAHPRTHGQPTILPPPSQPARTAPVPTSTQAMGPLQAIPRSRWAKAAPIAGRLNPLGSVERITVHHEGSTPVWFSDVGSTAERLDLIRKNHLERLRAGDIGYHFVIDRSGRLWQGRDLRYQGAHVKDHNEHNIGVMVLGNFDEQRPTDQQLVTLRDTVGRLMRYYDVPLREVYTHRELNPTTCPGGSLQAQVNYLRRSGDPA